MQSTALRAAIAATAMGVSLAISAGGTATAAEVNLRLHHLLPPVASPHKNFLMPWAEKVMKESGGRIAIEVIPSMGLGGTPPQLVDQVVDGRAEIVWSLPAYTPGRFPKTETFELPGVNADPITTNKALMDFYDKHLKDEYKDMHVLLLHVHAGQAFHSIAPIRSLADLKGMKIRAPGNTGTLWLEEAGAIPVQGPVPEIPQMLSKHVVDAVMIPFEIAPAYKVAELTKFTTTLKNDGRIHTSAFVFAMNSNAYNKMPADLKKVIDANSGKNLATFAGQVWIDAEKPGQKMAADRKNEAIVLPDSDMKALDAINQKVVDRWVAANKGKFDGAALVRDAKDLLKKNM